MAMTGYAAGSPQAPQSALPGGALVLSSRQNLAYPSMDGAGQTAQTNPDLFQNLMNILGGIPGGAQALRYGPGAATAVGAFGQGDVAGGLGAAAATVAAGRGMKALAERTPNMNPFLRGGLELGGSLLASNIGAQLGRGVAAAGNQLFGGAQAAVGDATNMLAGAQRESGQAAGTGVEAGVASDKALAQRLALMQAAGVNIPRQYLEQNYQAIQKYKEADKTRIMQLNQQNAQLTGQLNQQIIAGQLASGAQAQAGATTRDILTSNPYAASVLQTGGVRGI